MSHGSHGGGHDHRPKKKKKGTKFPWGGILALWVLYSCFDFHPLLGVVVTITLGLVPGVVELIMYPFQKLSEMEGDKKGGSKKEHSHGHH